MTAIIISPLGMEVQDGQRRYLLNIFDKITDIQTIYSHYTQSDYMV